MSIEETPSKRIKFSASTFPYSYAPATEENMTQRKDVQNSTKKRVSSHGHNKSEQTHVY
jgi:hypothetical protein